MHCEQPASRVLLWGAITLSPFPGAFAVSVPPGHALLSPWTVLALAAAVFLTGAFLAVLMGMLSLRWPLLAFIGVVCTVALLFAGPSGPMHPYPAALSLALGIFVLAIGIRGPSAAVRSRVAVPLVAGAAFLLGGVISDPSRPLRAIPLAMILGSMMFMAAYTAGGGKHPGVLLLTGLLNMVLSILVWAGPGPFRVLVGPSFPLGMVALTLLVFAIILIGEGHLRVFEWGRLYIWPLHVMVFYLLLLVKGFP